MQRYIYIHIYMNRALHITSLNRAQLLTAFRGKHGCEYSIVMSAGGFLRTRHFI